MTSREQNPYEPVAERIFEHLTQYDIVDLMYEMVEQVAKPHAHLIPPNIQRVIAERNVDHSKNGVSAWLDERDEMTYMAEQHDLPGEQYFALREISLIPQAIESIDPRALSVSRFVWFLELLGEFDEFNGAPEIAAQTKLERRLQRLQHVSAARRGVRGPNRGNRVYLKITANYFPIIDLVTTALDPVDLDALLADVTAENLDRLPVSELDRTDRSLSWDLECALRERRYDDVRKLGPKCLAAVDGEPIHSAIPACFRAAEIVAQDLPPRDKGLRVMGTLRWNGTNPAYTTREIYRYRYAANPDEV
ncbi:hypothetical protein CGLAU_05475 [Corynebacterium glaucum]|uniref:Uncharacterized protein n=1 Tax=Corynebacterium glaucum TaxID=187491 RepID=A0A1Q2HW32_9CORY|nr:hypothetical protein [Corynebacterium glaucum]AQQ15066.1 hypothetical protein CGLAU_05475 [Corynebacterium glaucum]